MPDQFDSLNDGKGEGCAYRGRALIEMGTVMGEEPEKHVVEVDSDDLYRLHVSTGSKIMLLGPKVNQKMKCKKIWAKCTSKCWWDLTI